MSILKGRTYEFESGKLNNYLHLVDIKQFNRVRVFSCFIAEFDEDTIILDCGTSFEINRLLRYMKKNNISLSSVRYIIPTHHHFDHIGGLWKLYSKIKEENPDVRILCSLKFKERIDNFKCEPHFFHAKKTFGGLIGEIRKIDDNAFKILNSSEYYESISNKNIIESFRSIDNIVHLSIIETPGHAPDHACPMFFIDDQLDFIYFGCAMGLKHHKDKMVTLPSCSAPNFNYNEYMKSVEILKELSPLSAGFSHAGVVLGMENVREIMEEHTILMKEFREMIINYYNQIPETRYVFDNIFPWMESKTDVSEGYADNEIVRKLSLSVVFGMMVDLGYREI